MDLFAGWQVRNLLQLLLALRISRKTCNASSNNIVQIFLSATLNRKQVSLHSARGHWFATTGAAFDITFSLLPAATLRNSKTRIWKLRSFWHARLPTNVIGSRYPIFDTPDLRFPAPQFRRQKPRTKPCKLGRDLGMSTVQSCCAAF